MKSIEVEGKTTKEAIQKALHQLGVTRDEVKVKVLCEGTSGLFGMEGLKQVKVKVTLKEAKSPSHKS